MIQESSIVKEVRERAMKISERFDHDLKKYCEYLREQEKNHPEKVVNQIAIIRSKDFHATGSN